MANEGQMEEVSASGVNKLMLAYINGEKYILVDGEAACWKLKLSGKGKFSKSEIQKAYFDAFRRCRSEGSDPSSSAGCPPSPRPRFRSGGSDPSSFAGFHIVCALPHSTCRSICRRRQ